MHSFPGYESTIRDIVKRVNLRFPKAIQEDGVTPHSTRRSFVTRNVNSSLSDTLNAQDSKQIGRNRTNLMNRSLDDIIVLSSYETVVTIKHN